MRVQFPPPAPSFAAWVDACARADRADSGGSPLGSQHPSPSDDHTAEATLSVSTNATAPTWLSAATASPRVASVFTAVMALLIHPWSGKSLSQPISFELRDGNPFAYMTLLGLAGVVLVLGARFWRGGHILSAGSCGACVVLLTTIPATDPQAVAHNLAFFGLVVIATGLFLVWAMDTFDVVQVLPPLLPFAFGLAFRTAFGIGGFQLMLIGSLLVALNLTHRHLLTR